MTLLTGRPPKKCCRADHRFLWSAVLCGLSKSGTGPSPLLLRAHQSRLDRIPLDITDYVLEFLRRTNPVIVGLLLPKGLSAASQHTIGNPAGPPFQPAHDVRHRDMRLPHCVHMIRHDRPGVKVVRMTDGRTMLDSIFDNLGDAGVLQPDRPGTTSVKPLVANVKRNAARVFGCEDLRRARRSRPGKAPCYKDNAAIREPMRKMPAIEKHGRPQKTMVCPTAKTLTTLAPVGRPQRTMVCLTAKTLQNLVGQTIVYVVCRKVAPYDPRRSRRPRP